MFSLKRIFIALIFALSVAGVTLAVAEALNVERSTFNAQPSTFDLQPSTECSTCHTDFQMTWESGAHGQAMNNPAFTKAWNEQGKPSACLACHVTGFDEATAKWTADGVTCAACHTDSGGEHPKTSMSVDTSPNACGKCHTDTRFGWQEWEGSTHYKSGMDCVNCHDPHSATVKIVAPRQNKDASGLCVNCHKDIQGEGASHGIHAQKGVTCVDCHITRVETQNFASLQQPAHTVPDHSFKASLTQCTSCHKDQLHTSGEASGAKDVPASAPTVNEATLLPEPKPVSPLGYAGLATLIGLAAGMLLSPWLERWYRFVAKKTDE